MEVSIDKIFEFLSWNNSKEVQEYGVELANNIKNLSVLIMPIENKSIWENCAKVLISKNDEELERYFIKLFEWLKDMNWPGAYLIYDRLIRVSIESFFPAYQYSLLISQKLEDDVWEDVLNHLFIEYVFNLINCQMSFEAQSQGRILAKNVRTIIPFIQPLTPDYNKNVWENCAIIISEESDEKLKPHLVELLEWLQDMNWPGAFCILNRLQAYCEIDSLDEILEVCFKKAEDDNDENWINEYPE